MALPETIPVKYTEGEDAYLSVRPIVRQRFSLEELLDMVLGITGKNVARIQQILRSGTVTYHSYRYWWAGFEAGAEDLSALLARFPDAEPARGFRPEQCTAIVFESGGQEHWFLELSREAASQKRFLRTDSLWDCALRLVKGAPPAYVEYSYAYRADLYGREVSAQEAAMLASDAARVGPRALRARLARLPATTRILFVCPRIKSAFARS